MEKIALVVSVLALILSITQFLKESSRQKKESTLVAYNELQNEVFTPLNDLLWNLEKENKSVEIIDYKLEEWESTWGEVTTYLAKLERFSVGINSRIYSLDTLNRLGGGYFIRLYDTLTPIIEKKQQEDKSEGKHYDELMRTVEKLRDKRKAK